ncbi:MAG: FAD-binding oxidoreductase [Desulfobacterales bacterium]|nr:FAD-binding oxidoreductase [Desulfobacterales bacterium]
MKISDDGYKALEEAVGPDNVTKDPAMLDSYAWQPFLNMSGKLWMTRPVAVALPGTTEEVQAVVKACNRHGLKFKALSTGWGSHNGVSADNVVQIDLRRMDRIIEIDEKNMYAVVEPYVCGGELQAEAWKVGLNTHLVGAGPHGSPLASATSMHGCGNDSISMSTSSRNLMGVEWVLPTGDVLRLGTLGSGAGWFSGDGPGPSLRGIVRGTSGAFGGFGVFTKAALKLYNWPGPKSIETKGMILDSNGPLPDCMRTFMCAFGKEKDFLDATYQIGEAEIGYHFANTSGAEYLTLICPHLLPKIEKRKALMALLNGIMPYPFFILLAGSVPDELEYQEEVLHKIVKSCDGIAMDISNTKLTRNMMGMNMLRNTIMATIFRSGNLFATNLDGNEAMDSQMEWSRTMEKVKSDYIREGRLVKDSGEKPYIIHYENNLYGHSEAIYFYDQRKEKHLETLESLTFDTALAAIEQCNIPLAAFDPIIRKVMSPLAFNFNEWQKKISQAFDPNGVSDTKLYTDEMDPDYSRIDPKKIERLKALEARFQADETPEG